MLIAVSAIALDAHAGGLFAGGGESALVSSNVEIFGYDFGGAERQRDAQAGTTVTVPSGWRASLFVSHVAPSTTLQDDSFRIRPSTFVSARLSRPIAKGTRLSFDIFNIFDQRARDLDYLALSRTGVPASPENFLFAPGEPRGFRINLRKAF